MDGSLCPLFRESASGGVLETTVETVVSLLLLYIVTHLDA